MRTRVWLIIVVSLLFVSSQAAAEEIAGLPLHTQRIDRGVIRLWVGDHISSTTVLAFATEKGIVVVDTFGVPQIDTGLRQVIARELGRSDFAYLINTHEHADHTGGNAVYSDCTIVGHESVKAGMAATADRRDTLMTWHSNRIAELEHELETVTDDAPRAAALAEDIILNRLNLEVVAAAETPPPPNLTFSDRLTLDLKDTTFELFYVGGMHTASDTAIFVPERGLLLTGDTMADVWLTDTPGCLAAFSVRDGIAHDFPRWLANWDLLLGQKDRITTLLPAHWNGELSIAGAEARVEYIRTLWNGIRESADQGASLENIQTDFRLDTRFPELVESPGFSPQRHYASVAEIWKVATGQASAARTVYTLIEQHAAATAISEVLAERGSDSPGYFYSEAEFNAYGYAFLQRDMVGEAVKMFEINTELFPASWNVYDSLGEALLRAGNAEDARAMYEKSLVLNPESPSGLEALKSIQKDVTPL